MTNCEEAFKSLLNLYEEEQKVNPIHCDVILKKSIDDLKDLILANLDWNVLNIYIDDNRIWIKGLGYTILAGGDFKSEATLTINTDGNMNYQFNPYRILSKEETERLYKELKRIMTIRINDKKQEKLKEEKDRSSIPESCKKCTEVPIDFIKDFALGKIK